MNHPNNTHGILEQALNSEDLKYPFSRRQFLKWSGVSIVSISALAPFLARGANKPFENTALVPLFEIKVIADKVPL